MKLKNTSSTYLKIKYVEEEEVAFHSHIVQNITLLHQVS